MCGWSEGWGGVDDYWRGCKRISINSQATVIKNSTFNFVTMCFEYKFCGDRNLLEASGSGVTYFVLFFYFSEIKQLFHSLSSHSLSPRANFSLVPNSFICVSLTGVGPAVMSRIITFCQLHWTKVKVFNGVSHWILMVTCFARGWVPSTDGRGLTLVHLTVREDLFSSQSARK